MKMVLPLPSKSMLLTDNCVRNIVKYFFLIFIFCLLLITSNDAYSYNYDSPAPQTASSYTSDKPASAEPLLTWKKNTKAIYYEVEIFDKPINNLSTAEPSINHVFFTDKVFVNAYRLTLKNIISSSSGNLYWRVRAMDINHNPITPFSALEKIYYDTSLPVVNAPIPISHYNTGNGSILLYPVYEWIPNPDAAKFELEILSAPPENPQGTEPSKYRIFAKTMDFSCEYYDPEPRIGTFYWRVRALDENNQPIGVFSPAEKIVNEPSTHYQVGIFGDSISHGGGHLSFGPEDFEFSYAHYLNFPSINLSQSGDTINMMVKRFDADVLPFKPKYLLIMGASNSLRAGISAEKVILGLKILQQKCYDNDIEPVLLTLPSINPDNIKKIFDESTAPGWADEFNKVNAYIRTQTHIDIAADFPAPPAVLPTSDALDGLHLDDNAKAVIGQRINNAWPAIIEQASSHASFSLSEAQIKKFFSLPDVYDL